MVIKSESRKIAAFIFSTKENEEQSRISQLISDEFKKG